MAEKKRLASLTMLLLSVFCILYSKPAAAASNKGRKKKISIFQTSYSGTIPVLLTGQLDNRLFATFSGLSAFSCHPVPGYTITSPARKKLSAALLILSTNNSAGIQAIPAGRNSLSASLQRSLSSQYLLVFPELTSFSLSHLYKTATNRPPGSRTNRITVLSNSYRIRTDIVIRSLNPFDGKIRKLAEIQCRTNAPNRFSAFSAVVNGIGNKLASIIENSTLFDLETEINYVRGNTIHFFISTAAAFLRIISSRTDVLPSSL